MSDSFKTHREELLRNKDFERSIDCEGIRLFFSSRTNGAGLETRQDFVNTVGKLWPGRVFKNCLEWCSGPGFYGFSLLSAGIVEDLVLSDKFEPAIQQANKTILENNLQDRCHTFVSDCWDAIPPSKTFDLIIGNPPHFNEMNYYNELWTYDKRIFIDKDWSIHRKFFRDASKYMTKDGEILLIECAWGSGVTTFEEAINSSNLKILDHFLSPFHHEDLGRPLYYLRIGKA